MPPNAHTARPSATATHAPTVPTELARHSCQLRWSIAVLDPCSTEGLVVIRVSSKSPGSQLWRRQLSDIDAAKLIDQLCPCDSVKHTVVVYAHVFEERSRTILRCCCDEFGDTLLSAGWVRAHWVDPAGFRYSRMSDARQVGPSLISRL